MDTQQIISIINSLPTRYTERTAKEAEAKILATAEALAPLLTAKGLQISKGGSSPTTKKSYSRIYLERVGNTSHDSRHAAYQENVICEWEWQVKDKYGFHPITASRIIAFCDSLMASVEAA